MARLGWLIDMQTLTPQQKAPLHIKLVYSYCIIGVLSNAESEHDLIFLILVSADSNKVLQPAIIGCLYLCNIARNWKREGEGKRERERERERDGERETIRDH